MDLVVVQELNRAEILQGERLPSLQDPKPSHSSRDSNIPPLLPPTLPLLLGLPPLPPIQRAPNSTSSRHGVLYPETPEQ